METSTTDTASQILDAAEQAFADAGFAGARVNAIAEAAGVNKAMLYYYFQSKEGLYKAVLERVFGQVTEVLAATIETSQPVDIQGFLDGYRTVVRSHPHLPRLIMRDVIDGAPNVREILAPKVPLLAGQMGMALQQGQQDGRINPEINPMIATPVLVSPFVMFALLGPIVAGATGMPLEALTPLFDQTAEQILLRGLMARPEES